MTPMLGIMASSISGSKIATGSFYSIATVTAAGGETSLTFSSIPSTYKHLQIRGMLRDSAAVAGGSELDLQFNSDSTSGNYWYHRLYGNGTSALATGGSYSAVALPYFGSSGSNSAGIFGAGIINIIDYASTSKYKTVRSIQGIDANILSTSYQINLSSGMWNSTSAITTIKLLPSTSFAAGSTFALYGIN